MSNTSTTLNTSFFISLLFIILLAIGMTWFIASYWLGEFIQGVLYPYSDYPVIVSQFGNVLMIPGWTLVCLASLLGLNEIALGMHSTQKAFFMKVKSKSLQCMFVLIIFSVIAVVADYFIWKGAAQNNGYAQCPSGSRLLLGSKTAAVWSREKRFCYDNDINHILSTGTHEQVVAVAKYLDNDAN